MNARIHPAEKPLLAYLDYQVELAPRETGAEPTRYRAQKVHGEEIVCVLGLFDSVVEAILAIDEHMSLCAASGLLGSFQLQSRAGGL